MSSSYEVQVLRWETNKRGIMKKILGLFLMATACFMPMISECAMHFSPEWMEVGYTQTSFMLFGTLMFLTGLVLSLSEK